VNARLKTRLERLEWHAMPDTSERQTMEIQFISPEKVVTSTLCVTLGPTLPTVSSHLIVRCGIFADAAQFEPSGSLPSRTNLLNLRSA
jgi:hypothetical protein